MSRRIGLFSLAFVLLAGPACVHRAPEATPSSQAQQQPPPGPKPIEIPRRQGTPVVLSGVTPVQAALFPEELDRLTRWVGRLLATQPQVMLDVVPLEQLAAVKSLVRSKRLALDAPTCAAQPALSTALDRRFPDAARAHAFADCSRRPCRLLVEVTQGDGDSPKRLGAWSATVAEPAGFDQWEDAAQQLAPDPDPSLPAKPAPNEDVTSEDQAQVTISDLVAQGPWVQAPTPKAFADVTGMFTQCHEKGRISRGDELLALEYDPGGNATRCEGYSRSDPPPAQLLSCFCNAALEATVPPGEAHRRLALSLHDPTDLDAVTSTGDRILARVDELHSTDPAYTAADFAPVLPWAGLCYGITRLREEVAIPFHLELDPSGAVQKATTPGSSGGPELDNCVTGYLRFLAFPCTSNAAPATIDFSLHLQRQPAQNLPTSAAPSTEGTSRTSSRDLGVDSTRG